jgi:hypothetical protein
MEQVIKCILNQIIRCGYSRQQYLLSGVVRCQRIYTPRSPFRPPELERIVIQLIQVFPDFIACYGLLTVHGLQYQDGRPEVPTIKCTRL